ELGAELTGYSLDPPYNPALFDQLYIADRINHIKGDVRDLDSLSAALDRSEADVVFHLAAQALVLRSYHDPVETYSTNVMGTINLLEAARRSGKPIALVIVTSDKCYEDRGWTRGYRESDTLGGRDPYSNSKACVELVACAYRQSYFDPTHSIAVATA